jgi:hypothetical protein
MALFLSVVIANGCHPNCCNHKTEGERDKFFCAIYFLRGASQKMNVIDEILLLVWNQ